MAKETPKLILDPRFEKFPDWQLHLASQHAASYAEDHLKLDLDKDGNKYVKAFQKAFEKYLDEGVNESLTPHMLSNPTTPIGVVAFDEPLYDPDSAESYTSKYGSDGKEKTEKSRLIRSALNTLTLVVCKLGMGIEKDAYQYHEGVSKETATEIARLKRVFVLSALTELVRPLLEINPRDLNDRLNRSLHAASEKHKLSSKEYRAKFAARVKAAVKHKKLSPDTVAVIVHEAAGE